MAIPFSSTTTSVRSLCQPKSLLPFRDSHNCTKRIPAITTNLSLSSSSSNYLKGNAIRLLSKPVVTKKFLQRRAGIMCATIEEIEAEKSLIEKDAKKRMDKAIESVRENFDSIRTGRASPNMLDRIEIEYYGTPVSLKSVAQISSPEASSLLIQPFDKSCLKVIEKAIVASDLGITPNNDGEVIRLTVPQLTADRRKELSKIVAKQAEDGKRCYQTSAFDPDVMKQQCDTIILRFVAIRNIRRDAIKSYEKLEKDKKLSEDNVKDLTGDLQKMTDEYMKKVESVLKQKEKELLTV